MSADLATGSRRTQAGGPVEGVNRASEAVHLAPEAVHLAPEAVHLAPEATPRWRALLESHWRARLERVTELSLAYHDAEEAHAHSGAGPQARPLLRQAVAERRALAEIEAALTRLASGAFGWCERCGAALPAGQLTRTPQARYCVPCDRGARRSHLYL
jgi:DnaK suppressor protein